MQPISTRFVGGFWGRLGCLVLGFGGAAVLAFLGAVKGVTDGSLDRALVFIALGTASLLVPLIFGMWRWSRKMTLDGSGVTTAFGAHLPWPTMRAVTLFWNRRRSVVLTYKVQFAGGTVHVFPQDLENSHELVQVLGDMEKRVLGTTAIANPRWQ